MSRVSAPRQVPVIEGRVFCELQGRTVALSTCFDCPDIKAVNERGRSPFIICDSGHRPDDEDGGQRALNWWLKRGAAARSLTRD